MYAIPVPTLPHFQCLVQDKEDVFQSVLEAKRKDLQETAPISIARVLAAREGWAPLFNVECDSRMAIM